MSMFSFMRPFYRDFWDCDYPHRIMDQHFGLGLHESDLLPPVSFRGFMLRPRTDENIAASGKSEVISEKDKFEVLLNVKQFKPDEITVKIVDDFLVIHGQHDEKQDEHGLVCRAFTRRYALPQGVDPDKISSSLSPDGVLSVKAPRKVEDVSPKERIVPINIHQQSDAATSPHGTSEPPKAAEAPASEPPKAAEAPASEPPKAAEAPASEPPKAAEAPASEPPKAAEAPQSEAASEQPKAVEAPHTETSSLNLD